MKPLCQTSSKAFDMSSGEKNSLECRKNGKIIIKAFLTKAIPVIGYEIRKKMRYSKHSCLEYI